MMKTTIKYVNIFVITSIIITMCACTHSVDTIPIDDNEIHYKNIIYVGANKEYKTISEAAIIVKDSTLIEVDAGIYLNDVVKWTQKEIYIRSIGGEVILDGNGSNDKGIWEVIGGKIKVEGITFKNSRVNDKNGAGIRFTSGELIVERCRFLNNEMGILTGNSGGVLTIRNSEFGFSGYGDGYSHNLYVGYIDNVVITGCYFHHANNGHLLKSRAKISIIKNCRITDENDISSNASYEIDFPSGGINIVVGNIIQQSTNSPNTAIIAFAEEYNDKWSENVLYLSHNTILNSKESNNPLFVQSNKTPSNSIMLVNNLLSKNILLPQNNILNIEKGNQTFNKTEIDNNYIPTTELYNELLNKIESDIDKYLSSDLKTQNISLIPTAEYVHSCSIIKLNSTPKIAGAIQKQK